MIDYTRQAKPAKLNIAPLIDLIFILLIFFVVSTTFSKLPGIEINRPDGTVVEQLPVDSFIVAVTKDGQFYVDTRRVSGAQLKSILTAEVDVKNNVNVIVMPDEDSAIKWSIEILDICKQLGIENVSVAEEVRSN